MILKICEGCKEIKQLVFLDRNSNGLCGECSMQMVDRALKIVELFREEN